MDLKKILKFLLSSSLFVCLSLGLLGSAIAGQEALEGRTDGRVVAQAPRKDAAFLPKLLGLANNVRGVPQYDVPRTNNEGIVIRGSYVKDGKVIIPASGIYLTNRSSNLSRLAHDPYVIGGKIYYFITDLYERVVINDVTMKKGDIAWVGDEKARGFQLVSTYNNSWYTPDSNDATFQILKTTGNFYGASFPVDWSDKTYNLLTNEGSGLPEGSLVPTLENEAGETTYLTSTSSVGRSWVVVDDISDDGSVHVKEMVTDNNIGAYFSPNKPMFGEYAKGQSFKAGDYTVTVDALTDTTATISIDGPGGKVTEKMGVGDGKNIDYVPIDIAQIDQFWMKSKDGKAIVHLDIRSLMEKTAMVSAESIKAAIADGKVKLFTYTDVMLLEPGKEWVNDTRFLTRPET